MVMKRHSEDWAHCTRNKQYIDVRNCCDVCIVRHQKKNYRKQKKYDRKNNFKEKSSLEITTCRWESVGPYLNVELNSRINS